MKIIVNGNAVDSNATNLATLLEELGKGKAKVATAVNETFVSVGLRDQTTLSEGDRVEIVAPRQGG